MRNSRWAGVSLLLALCFAQPGDARGVNDRWPHFSPDGTHIAFTSDRDGTLQVYVMRNDGGDVRRVARDSGSPMSYLGASWFPNGDLLYVGAKPAALDGPDNSEEAESFIESDANGEHRRVIFQGVNDERPQVSPSGSSLVFEAERGPFNSTPPIDIEVFDIATLTLRSLTHGDGQFVQAAWSPDGSKIAYACGKVSDKELQICIMDADGTNGRTVTRGAGSHEWPSWSPDSKRLAYFIETRIGGKLDCNIAVMGADDTDPTLITHHSAAQRDETPSWAPDGKHIAFQTDRLGAGLRIAVMNSDGTAVQILTK